MRFASRPSKSVRAFTSMLFVELEKIGDLNGIWDRERLGQVIFNLVTNALIHASAKRVDFTVVGQGPEVVLRVTNQGAPIPPDMHDSIFEPFD